MEPILLKVSEAAPLLALSRSKAYSLVASGKIPSIKLDGAIRISLADLRSWAASRSAAAVPAPDKPQAEA